MPPSIVSLEVENCLKLDLGKYQRKNVGNLVIESRMNSSGTTPTSSAQPTTPKKLARDLFDQGLIHFFGFHHEEATRCFSLCLQLEPDCALAHGMISLCNAPNYNFNGTLFYENTNYPVLDPTNRDGLSMGPFPSQQRAEYHSRLAMEKSKALLGTLRQIPDVEFQILTAIRMRTNQPGIDPSHADDTLGRPYANFLRLLHQKYPDDPEVAFLFSDSLMVLNAWNVYEFPTGRSISPDTDEVQAVLENSLRKHPNHPGLCHLYIHLSEMSNNPRRALAACEPLRTQFPDSGHLIHVASHIDVLIGDYESVVRWNISAIQADQRAMTFSSDTSDVTSFYFAYIVHDFHMLVYGTILGGFENKGMEYAKLLNTYLNEAFFAQHPELTTHLESYSAEDIHVLIRFGRWKCILRLSIPKDPQLMLFRTAATRYARAVSYASLGNVSAAKEEAKLFDAILCSPEACQRTLHNNVVSDILNVESKMMHGEIAYREGNYNHAFSLLREAVALQDGLKYDEPWAVMQPIRHALGGLLFEQGHVNDAEEVFRVDLNLHPKNPWSLYGLISCLETKIKNKDTWRQNDEAELNKLKAAFSDQRALEWADFDISRPCECCGRC